MAGAEDASLDRALVRTGLRSGLRAGLLAWRSPVYRGEDGAPSYETTRFLLLRGLGAIYAVAFLVAAFQLVPLVGQRGILPADQFLDRVADAVGGRGQGFLVLPSLFWLGLSDTALRVVAWVGFGLAVAVVLGLADVPILFALWALYLSIVHVGQVFWGYGWETMTLEAGFLALFLVPLAEPRAWADGRARASPVVLWLARWLAFRVMFGAGLIKLRGDACWRDLTCLFYHFETQPIPNPLSPWFDHLPHPVLVAGVVFNHVAELAAPWLLLGPRPLRQVGGLVVIAFQGILILSGNLSWLNWLTLVVALACFDDGFWAALAPGRLRESIRRLASRARPPSRLGRGAAWAYAALVAFLSIGPVTNMLSPAQAMNASFDPLHLVNTYGAFGSVSQVRDELVVSGSDAEHPGPGDWREYEFPCKPGAVDRRPCVCSPYQYRLAWQLWFAAMSEPETEPWLLHYVAMLLENRPEALALVETNPFPGHPPRRIKIDLYRYRFARSDRPGDPSGAWWVRRRLATWLPPVSRDDPELMALGRALGWM